jgi:hypothetical protein
MVKSLYPRKPGKHINGSWLNTLHLFDAPFGVADQRALSGRVAQGAAAKLRPHDRHG